MMGLRQDLLDFIGRRIVAAMKNIKPKFLSDVCNREEEACAEQEAIYLIGLADGMTLAEILSVERNDAECFKANDSSQEG